MAIAFSYTNIINKSFFTEGKPQTIIDNLKGALLSAEWTVKGKVPAHARLTEVLPPIWDPLPIHDPDDPNPPMQTGPTAIIAVSGITFGWCTDIEFHRHPGVLNLVKYYITDDEYTKMQWMASALSGFGSTFVGYDDSGRVYLEITNFFVGNEVHVESYVSFYNQCLWDTAASYGGGWILDSMKYNGHSATIKITSQLTSFPAVETWDGIKGIDIRLGSDGDAEEIGPWGLWAIQGYNNQEISYRIIANGYQFIIYNSSPGSSFSGTHSLLFSMLYPVPGSEFEIIGVGSITSFYPGPDIITKLGFEGCRIWTGGDFSDVADGGNGPCFILPTISDEANFFHPLQGTNLSKSNGRNLICEPYLSWPLSPSSNEYKIHGQLWDSYLITGFYDRNASDNYCGISSLGTCGTQGDYTRATGQLFMLIG